MQLTRVSPGNWRHCSQDTQRHTLKGFNVQDIATRTWVSFFEGTFQARSELRSYAFRVQNPILTHTHTHIQTSTWFVTFFRSPGFWFDMVSFPFFVSSTFGQRGVRSGFRTHPQLAVSEGFVPFLTSPFGPALCPLSEGVIGRE